MKILPYKKYVVRGGASYHDISFEVKAPKYDHVENVGFAVSETVFYFNNEIVASFPRGMIIYEKSKVKVTKIEKTL